MYKPIKQLGQNFLIDKEVPIRMVDLLDIKPEDTIIEIGSGLGVLTDELVNRTLESNGGPRTKARSHLFSSEQHSPEYSRLENKEIYAVEIDNRFVNKLNTEFLEYANIKIVEADILTWLPTFTTENKNLKVIGSLPYYITSPILHALVRMQTRPEVAVFLIQKEVAEKVCLKTPKANYLSSFIQTFFSAEYIEPIDRNKFDPSPKVDGGIIVLKRNEVEIMQELIEKYEGFLHKGFSNPRKMINKVFTKEELVKADLDGNLRPQDISVEKWVEIFKILV